MQLNQRNVEERQFSWIKQLQEKLYSENMKFKNQGNTDLVERNEKLLLIMTISN